MRKASGITSREKYSGTERRQTVSQLTACMRLIAIGHLTAGVAHELNNPLSVILGCSQSLLNHMESPETLNASLVMIEREVRRCIRVVQDLLSLARPAKPGLILEEIIGVLEGALCLVETQTRICRIEFIRHFGEGLPPLYVNRHRIQQMVINLCTNAADAMPKGGRLEVSVSLVSEPNDEPMICIRVSDTGAGIEPEMRSRIFEPFFTTKEAGKGTGLGLSLVSEVVSEHAGRIEVQSEPGKGSVFSVFLPIKAPEAAASLKNTPGEQVPSANA